MDYYLLNDGDEDEILAQVQEESLRHYNEVEQPKIQNEARPSGSLEVETVSRKDTNHENASILCTQVGGRAGTLLFEGEEAKGFHMAAGGSYIYPTNYPIRQYQAAIVRSALFKNTLVSLPTGLGKTFIAAVVMYNFYRWFPRGKVVFMAPTRPLVAQQIKACYSIMGIPPDDTTEMTGNQAADIREKLWKEKRVFFLTPQVMANDLQAKTCPADLIKCLVVDEAHKAVKDYAYCQVIKALSAANACYRTLALSATPGNDINGVIQVIRNLNICCLEMRGEDSIDVAPYTHGKSIEQIVVDLSPELLRVKEDFMQVYECFARSLIDNRALTSNIAFLSKFQVLKAMEKFRANPPCGMSTTLIGSLVSDFTMCMTFAHALELLQIYGLRAFYRYLADDFGEKSKAATTRLRNNKDLQTMLKKLHDILYPNPGSEAPYTWGHPKLKQLVLSLSDHFKAAEDRNEKTKAIVFCNYKIVVNEIVDLLKQCKSHIKAALFVGQSGGKEKGMAQAKQLQIMKDFREDKINCLVATCVAEEGLDIGEVDLIVLMESQKSPVRLVQRLGRTGRKRRGRCIVLLTRGKEENKFHEAMASRKSYVKNIVDSKAVKNSLCQYSHPMLPPGIKPQQQLVHIKVASTSTPSKPVRPVKKQKDIRECAILEVKPFLEEAAAEKVMEELGDLTLDFNKLPSKMELWYRKDGPRMEVEELFDSFNSNNLASWNDWNREQHDSFVISNTLSSELYCHLIAYKAEEDNQEYLRLVKDDAGEILAAEPAKPVKTSDDKIGKKKIVPKKNLGMDIRSCMAVAVSRANKKPKMDLEDEDVILIDSDDIGVFDLGGNDATFGGGNKHDGASNIQKKLLRDELECIIEEEAGNRLDIGSLFGMTTDEFEDLMYNGDLLCGVVNDVDMCYRLGKFLGDAKHFPKPKCIDENIFKFQCDQFLSLMDNVHEIKLPTVSDFETNCDLRTDVATKFSLKEPELGQQNHNLKSKPDGDSGDSNDYFVGIDDLFDDVSDTELKSSTKPIGFDDIGELSPIISKTRAAVPRGGLHTPLHKQTKTPIVSSTPINSNQKDLLSAEKMPEDVWELDDILEEEEKSKDENKTPVKDHINSSRDLFSSPPVKLYESYKKSEERVKDPEPVVDDFGEDWCMDDLFEDDKAEVPSKEQLSGTTFYGITQMVSQIERDKLSKKVVSEVIDLLDSPNSTPIGIENLHHNERQNFNKPSSNPNSQKQIQSNLIHPNTTGSKSETRVSIVNPKDHLNGLKVSKFDETTSSSNCCVLASAMPDICDETTCDNKSSHSNSVIANTTQKETVPIYVIDSDSNGSSKNDLHPAEYKEGKSTDKSAVADCYSLLDEDDDIFNCVDAEENVVLNENTKSVNFKNFKRKPSALLAQLVTEPDNDFPPEKRNSSLKVGSGSKRKLSFEDMLKELDESRTSKYFGSDKTSVTSCTISPRLQVVGGSSSKLTVTGKRLGVTDDEDVFIGSTNTKSIEKGKSSKDSLASSPIKKFKKRKKKVPVFVEREAEESGILSSDDSDNSSLDEMDDSFVDDESNHEISIGHYLKSVKSPVGVGKFKIPMHKRFVDNVYSQVVNNDEDDYENDSFCVDSNEENSADETTILEQAERKLAKRKLGKKIIETRSDDTEDERDEHSKSTTTPICINKKRRRLLESDSDHTPERVPAKLRKNCIVSPIEEESRVSVVERASSCRPADNPSQPPVIRIESDTDEEMNEAIKRSVLETKVKSEEELQFEEDLQKALFLSQYDVRGRPSEVSANQKRFESPESIPGPSGLQRQPGCSGDRLRDANSTSTNFNFPATSQQPPSLINKEGTSLLFMSQPLLKDRPLSTKPKVPKPSTKNHKISKRIFEFSDDSD